MANKLKLVIDTNIFIKGFFLKNKYFHCKTLMDMVENNNFDLVFSQDTIGELMYLVKNFAIHNIDDYKDKVEMINKASKIFLDGLSFNTLDTTAPMCKDEYDDMFIKCYKKSNADYIITDDYNSGMSNVKGIKVMSSLELIRKVNTEVAIGK